MFYTIVSGDINYSPANQITPPLHWTPSLQTNVPCLCVNICLQNHTQQISGYSGNCPWCVCLKLYFDVLHY